MLECTNDVGGYIIDTVIRIDKLQKEVVNEESGCVSCEQSLVARAYNTIPVSFTSCCGNPFTANLNITGDVTQFFRIESVRDRRFVTLRLLEVEDCSRNGGQEGRRHRDLVGTNNTCILDLKCCGLMQCYEAINVGHCNA